MKRITIATLIFALLAIGPISAIAAPSQTIPTFSITAVDQDNTVTIRTANFPANMDFKVTMNHYGTMGIGGTVVGTQNSGAGGSFTATYTIPAAYHGQAKIAIRLQSTSSGHYAYNWFWNNDHPDAPTATPGGPTATPGPTSASTSWGYPPNGRGTIPNTLIKSVTTGVSVTVKGTNFTTNEQYRVRIGKYGTLGVNGTVVDTITTPSNGAFTLTFNIPAALASETRLAIRFEGLSSGYYAYDWFDNQTSGSSATATPGGPTATPGPTSTPSTAWGYPPNGRGTIPNTLIKAVDAGVDVTIKGTNFTTNEDYRVRIGLYGTMGVGGIVVDTITTDNTGAFVLTFNIPASLASETRLAIRFEGLESGYYAYDWFDNDTDYP